MALNRLTLAEQVVNAVRFAPPAVDGPIVGETNPEHEPAPVPTAEEIAAQLADLRQEAYAEAFQQGFDEGKKRGLQEAAKLAAQLLSVMEHLAQPLAELDEGVVEAVSDLAVLIARHLVRRELRLNPGEVVGVVRETMRHLPVAPRAARIRLHPEDAELVQQAFALGDDSRSWRLEPDPLMTRGGCIVETDVSRIDASVESRLAAIASRMLGGDRESDHET